MADWTALRHRAYRCHLRLRSTLGATPQTLTSAETLLAAAEADTGVSRMAVRDTDPLLSGAHAVLDRDMDAIWYATGLPQPRQRLAQAHEFGHYWLHADVRHDSYTTEEENNGNVDESELHLSLRAVGYSPEERREREADMFAAEFLLPGPLLRKAFVEDGWTASQIAAHVGVPETTVLSQLMPAVLLANYEDADFVMSQGEGESTIAPTDQAVLLLDPSQKAAAQIERGPVLVDAGPGTGKTRTLVARVLHLLQSERVMPENVLALTFSNKAAEEMRTRLRELLGDAADRVWIGTFHAFGYEILRKYGEFPRPPRLVDTVEAVSLLGRHLDLLNLHEFEFLHSPTLAFPDILRCISRSKDELETPDDYLRAAIRQQNAATDERSYTAGARSMEVAHIYSVYQNLLEKHGLLDFGDLIMGTVRLLDARPEVGRLLQARFPHILADEYQDINRASAQLLRRLAGKGDGFWAVGDLRQAIYRFRGASPANVREFERDFPGGRRLRLDRNYRSLPSLVALFGSAASNMTSSSETDAEDSATVSWVPCRCGDDGPAITYAVARDEEDQADGLAKSIRDWEAAGVTVGDQVLLCRTNAQATRLAELLTRRGIPTQHLGNLFEREEIKDLLALVSLVSEPEGTALARVAQFEEYQIPPEDVARVLTSVRENHRRFPAAWNTVGEIRDLTEQGRRGLTRLYQHLEPLLYRGDAWLFLARYLTQTSGYLRSLLREDTLENRQKRQAIGQLVLFAQSVSHRVSGTLEERRAGFLTYLRLLFQCGESRSVRLSGEAADAEGVRLMTIHAAKGLEFPVVYMPNLIKDQFPPRKMGSMVSSPTAVDSDADDQGEECLFFVGLSRARDHLVLCRPATWRGKPAVVSPLLEDLTPRLAQFGARAETWDRQEADSSGELEAGHVLGVGDTIQGEEASAVEVGERPRVSVSLSALAQYQECPRQYYYQRIVRLPARLESEAYLAFHDCLEKTMRWAREEREAGRMPHLEAAREKLASVWEEAGPDETDGYARVLRQRADLLLENGLQTLGERPAKSASQEVTAELSNGRIAIPLDRAEELPDGTLQVVRQIKRRARADDHTNPRLALMRYALRQREPKRPVQIQLQYLQDGEQKEVREAPRYEPARVAKFDQALRNLRDGHFPAIPDEKRCARCPYMFICPS